MAVVETDNNVYIFFCQRIIQTPSIQHPPATVPSHLNRITGGNYFHITLLAQLLKNTISSNRNCFSKPFLNCYGSKTCLFID